MAKKKADLAFDADQYYELVAKIRDAHEEQEYEQALDFAIEALNVADGMMQFERRFGERAERHSLECIDYILRYAPLLFHAQALNILADVLRTQKRIDKYTTTDVAARVNAAYSTLSEAHRLWDALERQQEVEQDTLSRRFGDPQEKWRRLAEDWDMMGLIRRTPRGNSYTLSLTTRLDAEVRGRCSSCGVTARAMKFRFWEETSCPRCKTQGLFVIVPPADD